MIYSNESPVTFQDPLPEKVDVAIIGAGVIGTSTAYYLAREGHTVLLCDKGRVAGEQSSRNWGWIRQQGRDEAELPIVIDSIGEWQQIAAKVDNDIGFTRQGVLYAARTEQELAGYEDWLRIADQHQVDSRILTGVEVDELVRGTPGQWAGALYTPSDGRAEPFKAVPALARLLRQEGGLIRENCAVRTIETTGGNVQGVVTEDGPVRADTVVCAGGAWSGLFFANLGINLPQLTVRATVARTAPAPNILDGNAALAEVALRRRQDGGYTVASSGTNEHFIGADSFRYLLKYLPALKASVRYLKLHFGGDLVDRLTPVRSWQSDAVSPFEHNRVLNPEPSAKALRKMREGLARRVPEIADIPFAESWAGMIDVMPDVVPVMDAVDQYPGLYLATGFSGHGFGIGPGAGRIMADMVLGKPARHDLSRFRFNRFWDGTPTVVGPGL